MSWFQSQYWDWDPQIYVTGSLKVLILVYISLTTSNYSLKYLNIFVCPFLVLKTKVLSNFIQIFILGNIQRCCHNSVELMQVWVQQWI